MPNLLAQLVLYSWPLVTWFLFRRLNTTQALAATILLGYLFIPERVGYDPPLLPPINKEVMPSLCAAIAIWLKEREEARRALRLSRQTEKTTDQAKGVRTKAKPPIGGRISRVVPLILIVIAASSVLTWHFNKTPLIYGTRFLGGLQPYDIGSMTFGVAITVLPLLLGRKYLRTPEAQVDLLKVLAYGGIVYSFLVLWESRMSPQINRDLYGFFAASWIQHVREGGFRPIVFLAHGLRIGIFLAMAILALLVLARSNVDGKRMHWLMWAGWLMICLVLSRNMGATIIVIGIAPLILLGPSRLQFLAAALISIVVLVYPVARGSGLIPADRIVNTIAAINPNRAASLEFRLVNEDQLLQKANQKPLVGWGGWGRNRVYDPETGVDLSITDGSWIMTIGVSGWIGYLGYFGLICMPGIFSFLRHRRYSLNIVDAGFLLVLSGNLIDLIPNSSMVPVLWLMAGCAWGRIEKGSASIVEKRRGRKPVDRLLPGHTAAARSGTSPGQSLNVTPSKT